MLDEKLKEMREEENKSISRGRKLVGSFVIINIVVTLLTWELVSRRQEEEAARPVKGYAQNWLQHHFLQILFIRAVRGPAQIQEVASTS